MGIVDKYSLRLSNNKDRYFVLRSFFRIVSFHFSDICPQIDTFFIVKSKPLNIYEFAEDVLITKSRFWQWCKPFGKDLQAKTINGNSKVEEK